MPASAPSLRRSTSLLSITTCPSTPPPARRLRLTRARPRRRPVPAVVSPTTNNRGLPPSVAGVGQGIQDPWKLSPRAGHSPLASARSHCPIPATTSPLSRTYTGTIKGAGRDEAPFSAKAYRTALTRTSAACSPAPSQRLRRVATTLVDPDGLGHRILLGGPPNTETCGLEGKPRDTVLRDTHRIVSSVVHVTVGPERASRFRISKQPGGAS